LLFKLEKGEGHVVKAGYLQCEKRSQFQSSRFDLCLPWCASLWNFYLLCK